ncbi:uncharacterized protein DUF3558 [Saccharothrix saharensis]|uniref:Uncharacterized protein DUF3558 n=1 Tax=Saccharothrix saharensis TaxID=571190 RepID=A0A543JBU0_9PSEU|nr:DUF3558 domain-containing protein [Saccharothrix saharensis]TQM80234.1 uncharacterized protein DUF3558 [Saccharothrix saharensis]
MHLRRVPALTTVLALALTLGLSACATKVVGSPVAAAGGSTGEQTASGKPSSTKTSSPKASTKESAPKTTEGDKPSGDVKITTKKKTEGYEDCDILTPEEVAAAVGAAKGGEKGCVQSTEDPFSVVLFMVTFAEYEGEARTIEVGGNTAYEVKEKGGDCTVLVMLTDDPDEITPAFQATVTPIDEIDPCAIALKLATKAFEKIPNA